MLDTTVPLVQIQLADSGIVLGGGPGVVDSSGVRWKWSSDSALGDGADTREVTGDNVGRHGQYDATRFLGAQMPLIRGSATAPSVNALFDAERRIRNIIDLATRAYTITMPGFTGLLNARRQGRFQWTPIAVADGYGYAQFSFTLFCKDPWLLSAVAQTFSLAFGGSSGVDWTDPGPDWSDPGVDWSSSDSSSVATLVNDGPVAVPLLVNFAGPITNVVLTLQQGALTLQQSLINRDVPGADLLLAGQTLTVDNATGSVKLNGTAGRDSWLGGSFLLAPPGTSALYLSGSGSGTVTGSFTTARP